MCELRSLVHSALEVSSGGDQESFNLFLPPLGRNIIRKTLQSLLELKKKKTFGEEKKNLLFQSSQESRTMLPIQTPAY